MATETVLPYKACLLLYMVRGCSYMGDNSLQPSNNVGKAILSCSSQCSMACLRTPANNLFALRHQMRCFDVKWAIYAFPSFLLSQDQNALRLEREGFVFVYINVVRRGVSEGDLSLRTCAHHIWYTTFRIVQFSLLGMHGCVCV